MCSTSGPPSPPEREYLIIQPLAPEAAEPLIAYVPCSGQLTGTGGTYGPAILTSVWSDGFMFIGADVGLGLGFNTAQARLADLVRGGLLRHASDDAYRGLGSGLARVGPLGTAPGMPELVVVRFSEMTVHENFAIVAMRWEATGPGGALFPALDADITLTKAPDDTAILAVWGVYRPPFGGMGAGLDQVVLRRVAQATVLNFTHRIGAAITDPAASPEAPDTGPLPDSPACYEGL